MKKKHPKPRLRIVKVRNEYGREFYVWELWHKNSWHYVCLVRHINGGLVQPGAIRRYIAQTRNKSDRAIVTALFSGWKRV